MQFPILLKKGKNTNHIKEIIIHSLENIIPGTKGLEHRIGGLEKEDITGNVSYDPKNHENMCSLRA